MTMDPQLLTGLGAAIAIFLTAVGSAHASAHAGIFALREGNYKYFVPIVQAGVLSIYGIIVGVLLAGKLNNSDEVEITTEAGYRHLSAGLAVGLGVLASGCGMACFLKQLNEGKGICVVATTTSTPSGGDDSHQPLIATASANKQPEPTDFKKLVMIMIYLEAIGLYGLIVSLLLIGKDNSK